MFTHFIKFDLFIILNSMKVVNTLFFSFCFAFINTLGNITELFNISKPIYIMGRQLLFVSTSVKIQM